MTDTMPKGWMDAETARRWARRGVWAWRTGCRSGAFAYADVDELLSYIVDGEGWRYLSAHPDDLDTPAPAPAEAGETMQREAWAVVWSIDGKHAASVWNQKANAVDPCNIFNSNGHPAHVVRVVLTLPVPKPAPVLTVTAAGEVSNG